MTLKKATKQQKKQAQKIAQSVKKQERKAAKAAKKKIRTEKKAKIKSAKEDLKSKLSNLKKIKKGKKNWHSYLKFIENKAKDAYSPANTNEVKSIVEYAVANKRKVKMVGTGHSFSKILEGNDILVHPENLGKIKTFNALECKKRFIKKTNKVKGNGETFTMVEVDAGATIRNIDKTLEKKGLGLLNQGTYEGQRFWGAVSTSTHGSGVTLPPFPDMIVSVVAVVDTKQGVKAIRIERKDGPTRPRQDFKEKDVDELIKDNDAFNSIICSMGSMGIVTRAIILTRNFYYLHEYGDLKTWSKLKKKLTPSKLDRTLSKYRHYEFVISSNKAQNTIKVPNFKAKKGSAIRDLKAHGYSGDYVTTEVKRKDIRNKSSFKEEGKLPVALMLAESKDQTKNLLHPFSPKDQRMSQHASLKVLQNLVLSVAGIEARDVSVLAVVAGYAEKNKGLDDSYNFKRKYYHVFPRGGKKFGGYGFEVAAPYKSVVKVMDEILRLAEIVTKETNKNRPPKIKQSFFAFGPIGVRFVEASEAYMSPMYKRRSVMFEITITQKNMKKRNDLQVKAMTNLQNRIMKSPKLKSLGLRMHWGLEMNQIGPKDLKASYKKLDTFKQQRKKYNHNSTFNNSFSRRLELSKVKK